MNILLKRLRWVPALLGVAATVAAVGTTLWGDVRPGAMRPSQNMAGEAVTNRFTEELAASKFSRLPLVTYQPRDGELIFA
ncbi:MAG: hypothetical protein RMJ88_16545, partial [Thermogemmata sp.]|nr:hypothetical protein [Thermogemmata sp.]